MKWSWRIGRIAGIDIFLHATFLILLAWIGIAHYVPRQSWVDVAEGFAFLGALFGIIVLHELGHALAARRFGIHTRDITLLPIGGVARLERMPEDPKQELVVAFAGPAVNIVLAGMLFAILATMGGVSRALDVSVIGGSFLSKLLWANVALAVFNLLPAFPMDGGRVLRALLAMRVSYVRATRTAAYIGQGMALLFGVLGLLFNPFLVLVALFVWMGAAQERNSVQMRAALGGVPVHQAMITEFHDLSPHDPLSRPVEYILAGFQEDFPVVENGKVVGMLTRADVMNALAKHGHNALVQHVMQQQFETAEPAEMLENVVARLQKCACRSLPIAQSGRLVGLLTWDNIAEFLMIKSALQTHRA